MIEIVHLILRLPKIIRRKDFYSKITKKLKNKSTLGNKGAQWAICTELINKDSIIYSFGVGTDVSFDLEMINKFGVNIHAFDPTPKSIEWIKQQVLPEKFNFHPIGIAAFDGEVEFTLPDNPNFVSGSIDNLLGTQGEKIKVPVKDLISIMKSLSHNHMDILKMDIEGAEYDVIDDMIASNLDIKQILVEFHHRFPNIGVKKTKDTIKKLNNFGYRIFHISNNGEEYSFIKI